MAFINPERLWLLFFPRRCVWCAGVTDPDHMLCPDCEHKGLRPFDAPGLLPGTGLPLLSAFNYHSQASRILLNVKFHGARNDAHSIGYAMADIYAASQYADEPALFACVPMTPAKVRERGYNQSELITGAAARWLGAEFSPALLRKTRETKTQHDLHAEEREANVAGAFEANAQVPAGRRVVLCDDICTTGATLRACVTALEAAGAEEIICLSYLRTDKEEQT